MPLAAGCRILIKMADAFFSSLWRILQPYGCARASPDFRPDLVSLDRFEIDPSGRFRWLGRWVILLGCAQQAELHLCAALSLMRDTIVSVGR